MALGTVQGQPGETRGLVIYLGLSSCDSGAILVHKVSALNSFVTITSCSSARHCYVASPVFRRLNMAAWRRLVSSSIISVPSRTLVLSNFMTQFVALLCNPTYISLYHLKDLRVRHFLLCSVGGREFAWL